jgi:undecaprenyl diphosphate synthase
MISTKPHSRLIALAPAPIPKHIAIIMDGNRRWARERNLPVAEGYRRGISALRETVRAASDVGVPVLTVYGFSEENWSRPWTEISVLFDLCSAFAYQELDALCRDNVRVSVIGKYELLPQKPRRALENLIEKTAQNTGTLLNLAVNYSARTELRDAARALAGDLRDGAVSADAVDENTLGGYLYTKGLPDPDLLIRPGGEYRLSNFLLYQCAYTEIYVTDVCWPDFSRVQFHMAIAEFQRRQRRFGR